MTWEKDKNVTKGIHQLGLKSDHEVLARAKTKALKGKITAKDIYARGYAKNAKNSPTFKDSLRILNEKN